MFTLLHLYSLSHPVPRYLHSFPTRRSSDLLPVPCWPFPKPFRRSVSHSPTHARGNRGTSDCATFGIRLFRRGAERGRRSGADRKSTRLNSSHLVISYAVFCLIKRNKEEIYY